MAVMRLRPIDRWPREQTPAGERKESPTWRCGCGQEWVWRRTGWERLADAEPDVEEGRFDRAVLAASLAEAVSAVDAAARRLRAAWRNVGGDPGNADAEGG